MFEAFRRPLEVIRRGKGGFVAGRWQEGKEVKRFKITASVQGTRAEVLNTMLEGTRTTASYTLRTGSKLLIGTAGETMPDIVIIDNDQYAVARVTAWQNLGPTKHYEVVVMRIESDEN